MNESHGPDAQGRTITVSRYLARRLRQCGVDHVFGLPGDFNLALLDEMADEIEWVGSTNELNAAYTADGYARRRGLGAIVTTYGVGELSALNGIAGSAAESVPVIQITGAPSTTAAQAGSLLHHTLADGDFGRFSRMYQEVTVAGATLTAARAVAQIDHVLSAALREKKPGYLSIPVDVATAPVPEAALGVPLLTEHPTHPHSLRRFSEALQQSIRGADGDVVVIVGHLAVRERMRDQIARLADTGAVRIATLLDAKGYLDEAHPASLGTYIGALTRDARARALVERAAVVITVGTVLSDLLTGMFTDRLGEGSLISIGRGDAQIDQQRFPQVGLRDALAALTSIVEQDGVEQDAGEGGLVELDVDQNAVVEGAAAAGRAPTGQTAAETPRAAASASFDPTGPLTQSCLWEALGEWIPAGSPVIADAGTAFYGAAGLHLPGGSDLIGQPIWSSIGYTLPATLGIALADDARPILLIGDGSAQLTIQEFSTFAGRGLSPVIILINNDGYTVERAIRSPEAAYQSIARWDWPTVVRGLLPDEPTVIRTARTAAELRSALRVAEQRTDSLVFIEVVTDALDVPPLLAAIARGLNSSAATVSA